MKVVTIVGTRPNFIKEISLNKEFRKKGINEILVHTGQHYDYNMFKQFFLELEIPEPDYISELPNMQGAKRMGKMIEFIEEVLVAESPNACVIMGDVHSTMAGAIAASMLKIPIVHIEAGIRGGMKSNPEEVNRRVSDVLSDLLLTNCQSALENLLNEGYSKDTVFNTGDLMKDTLQKFSINTSDSYEHKKFILVTVHREENTDNKNNLIEIVEALIESGKNIYFPIHPRTKNKLMEYDYWHKLENAPHIKIFGPLGYLKFIELLSQSFKVITDSGGVRREAYLFGKPVINCGPMVWFPELIDSGWKVHTGPNKTSILDAIENFNPDHIRPNIFGNGNAAHKIVNKIIEFF